MNRFVVNRLVQGFLTLFFISLIAFGIFQATPGDPAHTIYGTESQRLTEQERNRINDLFGHNEPFVTKYLAWGKEVLQGNLGHSYRQGRPVNDIILESLPNTLLLFSLSMTIIISLSIFLGVKAGKNIGSFWDRGLTFLSITISSIPAFWLGIIGIYIFSVTLGWLPSSGSGDLTENSHWASKWKYLIMPVAVISITHVGVYARFLQEQYKDECHAHYVQVARANGVDESFIVRGILKNSLSPYVNYIGVTIPSFFGGSIVIESLFNWAGLGLLSVQSILTMDYPLLMGSILVTGVIVVIAIFLTDILSLLLQPKLRKGHAQ